MHKSAAPADLGSASLTPPEPEADAPMRALACNEILFKAGDAKTGLYVIEAGAICLYTTRWDGGRDVIEYAFPGDLVGLGFLETHACTARAAVETRVRCLPLAAADAIDARDARATTRYNAAIKREFNFRRESLVAGSRGRPAARLAALLLALSRRNGAEGRDPTLIDGVLDAEVVANYLGASLAQLAVAAVQLQARGWIKVAPDRCLRLIDVNALESMANCGSAAVTASRQPGKELAP